MLISKFEYATASPDGVHWGLINKKGHYVVAPEYNTIHRWKEGMLRLTKGISKAKIQDGKWVKLYDSKMYFINYEGRFIHSDPLDCVLDFEGGLAAVSRDKKWGFITKEGEVAIDFQFEMAYSFHEELSAVMMNRKWGFINRQGYWVIEPVYDRVQSFKFGLAVVLKGSSQFIIDTTAQVVAQPPDGYPWLSVKSENIILYGTESGDIGFRYYGFIDTNGNVLTSPEFYVESEFQFDLYEYSEDMLIVTNEEDQYGFLDDKGNLSIPCLYDSAEPFKNGYAVVTLDGEKYAIDKRGERSEIIESTYPFDEVLTFHEGLAAARKGDKWGFINRAGEVIINFTYNQYPPHKEKLPAGIYLGELFPKFSCGLLPIFRSDGSTTLGGFINSSGIEVIPTQFPFVRGFEEVIVELDNPQRS